MFSQLTPLGYPASCRLPIPNYFRVPAALFPPPPTSTLHIHAALLALLYMYATKLQCVPIPITTLLIYFGQVLHDITCSNSGVDTPCNFKVVCAMLNAMLHIRLHCVSQLRAPFAPFCCVPCHCFKYCNILL